MARSKGRQGARQKQRNVALPDILKPLARLVERQRYEEVEKLAQELRRVLPSHPYLLKSLSFALIGQGRHDDALAILQQAIAVDARDPELHNNLGIAFAWLMQSDRAIEAFDRALELAPGDAEVWRNKAAAYCHTSQWAAAIPCLIKAIELHPGDYDEAISLLADALLNTGQNEQALSCFTALAAETPDNALNLGGLLVLALRLCHWADLTANLERLRQMSAGFRQPALAPFHALAMPGISGPELRNIAETFVAGNIASGALKAAAMHERHGARHGAPGRRLRVGYLSYDFRDHPVGHVLPQIMELHDPAKIEAIAYSMAPDDDSAIRQRLVTAFAGFVDITSLGIVSGAERIANDRLDILIDLQGWTTGNRAAMLALRPAPIQINWLGYAGTMGHPRLADYLLGDPIVTPFEHQALYSEQILHLPHCYLPMDATSIVPPAPARKDAGLPDDAFVFCSMNNCYKLNPQVFDVWCDILKATPGSVLWLSQPSGAAAEGLRNEFVARGLALSRLVFAPRVASRADHLARLQLADLALDPSPYNSHSSGMDALWAGVPMVTLMGDSFAGRVGASLLSAAQLPECITRSWGEYLTLCIDLSRDAARLGGLRQRLQAVRDTAPLFDMKRLVDSLEGILATLAERRLTVHTATCS